MKNTAEGILLKKINYSETSLVTTFFTKEFGLKAFLFQGGKKKKGNMLHPLALVELTFYARTDSDLAKLTSIDRLTNTEHILRNPVKSSICFFLAEIIASTIQENDADTSLYDFLKREIAFINQNKVSPNYLIWFVLRVSQFMGLKPVSTKEEAHYLDVEEGIFLVNQPTNHKFIKSRAVQVLNSLNQHQKEEVLSHKITKTQRADCIEILLDYLSFHVPNFKIPKSLAVIKAVFE